jgi:hypothetical protein
LPGCGVSAIGRRRSQPLFRFERGLPREDSGKIFKRKLRSPYWEKVGRQI